MMDAERGIVKILFLLCLLAGFVFGLLFTLPNIPKSAEAKEPPKGVIVELSASIHYAEPRHSFDLFRDGVTFRFNCVNSGVISVDMQDHLDYRVELPIYHYDNCCVSAYYWGHGHQIVPSGICEQMLPPPAYMDVTAKYSEALPFWLPATHASIDIGFWAAMAHENDSLWKIGIHGQLPYTATPQPTPDLKGTGTPDPVFMPPQTSLPTPTYFSKPTRTPTRRFGR